MSWGSLEVLEFEGVVLTRLNAVKLIYGKGGRNLLAAGGGVAGWDLLENSSGYSRLAGINVFIHGERGNGCEFTLA